jgi:signal transduction histidine kinase
MGGGRSRTERAGRRSAGLEARIVAVALLSTITALLVSFMIYQWRNWQADRDELAADSVQFAHAMAVAAHRQLNDGGAEAQAAVAAMLYSSEHVVAVAYVDALGRDLRLAKPGHDAARLAPRGATAPRTEYRDGWLEVCAPHSAQGERLGEVVLRVDDDELVAQRLTNIAYALVLSLIATVAAALMARRMARRALGPLRSLDQAMGAVTASHDFTARLPIARDDEVGRLTERYNSLLAELEAYDGDLRAALAEANAAREAAEAAYAFKSQLLSNLSHELRTPLNGVLGMGQALLLDDLTTAQRERVDVIVNSGGALRTLLCDLLDLSDMESGRLRLHAGPFDLADVVGEACETALAVAGAKGLTLDVDVEAAATGQWRGDGARLRQVLYNLVSNALKFTEVGGVTVRVEAVSGGVVLSVTDTGIGIPRDLLPRLFESFIQGEGGATRRFGGAGVGLAISRRLVDLMGGLLTVESEVGKGSVFSLMLPLERAPEALADDDVGALRVLVAEDNETNQRVVRTVLNALGVNPVLVPDGAAAVEAWGRGEWDLVLMDIQMPVRDGVAATRDIRRLEAERGLSPTPIVALTANALPAQVDEYAAAGMNGVVPKPIVIEQLHAALVSAARAA